MHPGAWAAWLAAVSVFAIVASNPFYLALAIGAVAVVHLSHPPERSPIGRAVRFFVVLGVVVLTVRLVFVALLDNPGTTVLLTVPRLQAPRWLGAIGFGGDVTAEVLVAGTTEGLRVLLVLVAFGVFNVRADVASLARSVPPVLRDAGLVVAIALAFVPGVLRTMVEVRDAQRLRGDRGLRRLAPSLVVPVLGLSLERALLLAESMDTRGYGRDRAPRSSRVAVGLGLAASLVAVVSWTAGLVTLGAGAAVVGVIALVVGLRIAADASRVTRLHRPPFSRSDAAVVFVIGALIGVVIVWAPGLRFDPYPALMFPPVSLAAAALAVPLTAPAFRR